MRTKRTNSLNGFINGNLNNREQKVNVVLSTS